MPIYEFVCEACGQLVERLQKVSDPPPQACPECGGKMAKIMSRNSFQLKGGGWYRDLYSSSKGATNTADQGTSSATDKGGKGGEAAKAPAEAKPAAETKKD
jgi:putative FmdB family regulatory protein